MMRTGFRMFPRYRETGSGSEAHCRRNILYSNILLSKYLTCERAAGLFDEGGPGRGLLQCWLSRLGKSPSDGIKSCSRSFQEFLTHILRRSKQLNYRASRRKIWSALSLLGSWRMLARVALMFALSRLISSWSATKIGIVAMNYQLHKNISYRTTVPGMADCV